jgi:hypothetical protein
MLFVSDGKVLPSKKCSPIIQCEVTTNTQQSPRIYSTDSRDCALSDWWTNVKKVSAGQWTFGKTQFVPNLIPKCLTPTFLRIIT